MESTRTVERALDILECFSEDNLELGVTEVAKQTALAKATVFRIMHTLKARGYLSSDEKGEKFRLGPKTIKLGKVFLAGQDFYAVARPHMRRLRDELNESVSLYIPRHDRRICVERVESTHPLRRVVNVGDDLPLDRGAAGKVLLAFGPPGPVHIEPKDAEYIRLKGYEVTHGEREPGVSAIAAPIFDHRGRLLAALAISGPTFRFGPAVLPDYIGAVVNCARSISQSLGY
jgi:DNA-binding IclR family transcriptional regulator